MNDIEDYKVLSDNIKIELFIKALCKKNIIDEKTLYEELRKLSKIYHIYPNKRVLSMAYQSLLSQKKISKNIFLEDNIRHRAVRSLSGVLVVTLVMKPDKFSCPYDCYMCPDERIANGATVDMPRSYLSTEPAEMRAMEVDFDTVGQFLSRVGTLHENGHPIDKIEIIVLGGTFSTYPRDYQEEFIRDIFYAANTYFDDVPKRKRFCLEEEQSINESEHCHIVGISLETRPDQINKHEIKRLRKYGCTRVQMGIQHTDNDLLDNINRKHTVERSIKAIKDLKDVGFKVELHIMPDLPNATPEIDKIMIEKVFCGEDFQPDYVKIYPCLDVKYTKVREWKQQGIWKPYAEEGHGEKLMDVLIYALERIPYWTRDSRVQRDFPMEHSNNNFVGYISNNIQNNLYQLLLNELHKQGKKCKSIRNREVKNKVCDLSQAQLFVESYRASKGTEYFISYESSDRNILYGFVRLRFNDEKNNIFDVLKESALIRELHVYGIVKPVNSKENNNRTQHYGFGKKLMKIAENIAQKHGYKKIAVISAIGTRNYYRKLGYQLEETYMIKNISPKSYFSDYIAIFILITVFMSWIIDYLYP